MFSGMTACFNSKGKIENTILAFHRDFNSIVHSRTRALDVLSSIPLD